MATNLGYKLKKFNEGLSNQEKITSEQIESDITDAYKAELEQKLKEAFENNNSHTKKFSEDR